ncbi:hypothetical protein CBR_g8339 [Chara braunii]|uniref:Uncharacterized protein n=1 Tax=Chara braunii TaxID=69332 RepID=A0A388KLW1_CHABU|nr:hypothetical protein CBR_g8339 [Chara braunii]|eukprot:GBG71040.1 hypothetical protein CBR_g8339 [Chara braunii]
MATATAVELLEIEKNRLENAVKHLLRSNEELAEALQSSPDPDFEQAIDENRKVVDEMREKIARLEEELHDLRGPHQVPASADELVRHDAQARTQQDGNQREEPFRARQRIPAGGEHPMGNGNGAVSMETDSGPTADSIHREEDHWM